MLEPVSCKLVSSALLVETLRFVKPVHPVAIKVSNGGAEVKSKKLIFVLPQSKYLSGFPLKVKVFKLGRECTFMLSIRLLSQYIS